MKWIVATGLSWLGLAGLVDAWIEWHQWFEQGILQHWRSVQEWVIAILLDWLPFTMPHWLIDYSVIGLIVARCAPYSSLPFGRDDLPRKITVAVLFRQAPIIFLMWPIALFFIFLTWLEYYHSEYADSLRLLGVIFLGFVPVLFLISTTLYRLG